jgi:sugar lactone lactonase YvrE
VAGSDGALRLHLDGTEIATDQRLAGEQLQAFSVATGSAIESGRQLYVDDLTVVGESLALDDSHWLPGGRQPSVAAAYEDFETIPLGQLHEGGDWQDVSGQVAAGPSPRGTGVAAGVEAANAFDSSRGDGPGQFDEPAGVALDPNGNIYVTERLNHRVQRFSPDGTLIGSWGQAGEREGQFREPLDVAVDAEFVYVVDTWNHRVQGFDHQGNLAFVIRPEPALASPRGIFVKEGRIYVANSGRSEVVVFDRSGEVLQTIRGNEDSPLRQPVDLVIDSKGRIYVVNGGLNRLEIFSADGERLGAIPVPGWQGDGLKENYLAIDAEDTIYLTDWDARRVRRFRPDGTELEPVGPQMQRPSGVAIGEGLMIAVSRGENGLRLQEMPGVKPPPQP